MKPRSLGCLALFLIAGGVAIFIFWRLRTPPRLIEETPLAQAAPAERARRVADLKPALDQVRQTGESARRHEHKPFTWVFTQEQLNTLVQQELEKAGANSKVPVRDVAIRLDPDKFTVQGEMDYKGIPVAATLEGTLAVEDNRLNFHAQSLQIGQLNAPDKYREQAEKAISQQLNKAIRQAPGRITGVQLEAGKVTIQGETD